MKKYLGDFMKKLILTYGIIFLLSLSIALAVPRDLNIQIGKILNNSNLIEDATLEINFSLWTVSTGGSPIFTIEKNLSVSNGTTDVIIQPDEGIFINNSRIFLSITVEDDNESLPRINLTSVPYAIRANISDSSRDNSVTNKSILSTDDFSFLPTCQSFLVASCNFLKNFYSIFTPFFCEIGYCLDYT